MSVEHGLVRQDTVAEANVHACVDEAKVTYDDTMAVVRPRVMWVDCKLFSKGIPHGDWSVQGLSSCELCLERVPYEALVDVVVLEAGRKVMSKIGEGLRCRISS